MLETLKKRSQQNKAEQQQAANVETAPEPVYDGDDDAPLSGKERYAAQMLVKKTTVPVLDQDDQSFLEQLTRTRVADDDAADDDAADDDDEVDETDAEGNRPALPPRVKTPDLTWDSDSESFVREGEGKRSASLSRKKSGSTATGSSGGGIKEAGSRVGRRLTTLFSRKPKAGEPHADHLAVPGKTKDGDAADAASVSSHEADRERDDLERVLEDLDLDLAEQTTADDKNDKNHKTDKKDKAKAKKDKKAASRFTAVSLSADSAALVRSFVLVLKDLVNGVPTAADDLRHLLDDRDGKIARTYERLPSSLRKLVAQLPAKLTASLGPELLAVVAAEAAAAGGTAAMAAEAGAGAGAAAGAGAGAGFSLASLLPMLTKPSTLVKMLKGIMNALKLRWPAFVGTSAIWSVALFLLLFVLWYCHKRGRETRLEKEGADAGAAGTAAPAAVEGGRSVPTIRATTPDGDESSPIAASAGDMPRPPIGEYAPVQKS